jgi:hypothetical protein
MVSACTVNGRDEKCLKILKAESEWRNLFGNLGVHFVRAIYIQEAGS